MIVILGNKEYSKDDLVRMAENAGKFKDGWGGYRSQFWIEDGEEEAHVEVGFNQVEGDAYFVRVTFP